MANSGKTTGNNSSKITELSKLQQNNKRITEKQQTLPNSGKTTDGNSREIAALDQASAAIFLLFLPLSFICYIFDSSVSVLPLHVVLYDTKKKHFSRATVPLCSTSSPSNSSISLGREHSFKIGRFAMNRSAFSLIHHLCSPANWTAGPMNPGDDHTSKANPEPMEILLLV